jgi:hypothetical protein
MARRSWKHAYQKKYGMTPEERKVELARQAEEKRQAEINECENTINSIIPDGKHCIPSDYGYMQKNGVEYELYCAKNIETGKREFVLVGWANPDEVKEYDFGNSEMTVFTYRSGKQEVKRIFDFPQDKERQVAKIIEDCKSLDEVPAQIAKLPIDITQVR